MGSIKLSCIVLLSVGAFGGCAHLEIHKTTNGKEPDNTICFYRPAFYLSVTEDANKVKKFDIIKLPDYSKEYAVSFHQGWGTLDGSVGLTDGWMLSSIGSKTDSKGPETITAVASLLTSVKALMNDKGGQEVGPGLYRIEFDESGSISKLATIKVDVTP